MNVTIVNALGRHSKISVGNEIQTSNDVTLPISSDFLKNYSSKLNSKELTLQILAAEETKLKESHRDLFEKLSQLQREELLLNKEAERLHRLIIANKKPIDFEHPNQVVITNDNPSNRQNSFGINRVFNESKNNKKKNNTDYDDYEDDEEDNNSVPHFGDFREEEDSDHIDYEQLFNRNNNNNNNNNKNAQFGASVEGDDEDIYEI